MRRRGPNAPAIRAGVLACLAGGLLFAPGCATDDHATDEPVAADAPAPSVPRPETTGGERLTTLDRLDVFAGQTLVLPLDAVPPRSVRVALDDGRELACEAHQVRVNVPADPALAGGDPWLPAPGVWSSDGPGAATDPWLLEVALPPDAAGHDVVIEGDRIRTNWLPAPEMLPKAGAQAADPWRPSRPPKAPADLARSPRVFPESQSPITRWRWRLVADGLDPDASVEPFADPMIENLARQNERRWQVALSWLWAANTDVASRLRHRLAAVIDFGDGVYAPAWPTDHQRIDQLLAGLLDPRISPGRRAAIAEQWLREQPGAVAWIIDDGGTLDQQRTIVLPTLGAANLQDRAALAWSALGTAGATSQPGPDALHPIGALSQVASLVAPATPEDIASLQRVGEVAANVGSWSARLPVNCRPQPISPPGLVVGPLLGDLTMREWLAGRVSPSRGGVATAALLQRSPSRLGPDGRESPQTWELVIECRVAPGAGAGEGDSRDEVRVYFGAFGQASAVVRVTSSGQAEVLRGGGSPETHWSREGDTWRVRLALPAGAVEADGLVRLGVVRTDRFGRRSAWPRPMLPWQNEPARAAIDTRGWRGSTE